MTSLAALDKKHVWHPFTQQAEWDPLVITSAKGVRLTDDKGRRYIDGVSSLWVTVHGHREPALDRAVTRQLKKMAHVTFLGLTHEPAVRLAKALVDVAPRGLTRVFYSDNGSTSVEVALKMAFQSRRLRGEKGRTSFLALRNSYHGDTLGAVSVGGIALFHGIFKPLLFKSHFAPAPSCRDCPHRKKGPDDGALRAGDPPPAVAPKPGDFRPETGCRWECLGAAEKVMKAKSRALAAAVVEPVVQGASGMLVQPRGYLKGFERLCRKYGLLLIADEVATGFGRTGSMFAVEKEGVTPDFLCLSKSITGGYLPLAATLAREDVYRAFLGRYDEFKTFFHGHTYTANPLACAAALENLRLYKSRNLLASLRPKIARLNRFLKEMRAHPQVGDVRQAGMMAGIELVKDKAANIPYPVAARVGHKVCLAARRRGLWIRPLGDVIVLMPPLAINARDFETMLQAVKSSIEETAL
jgi:adenosylmethionine---8-amino-7-oxononanoate aminotransferase